jgi:hypothetical protein
MYGTANDSQWWLVNERASICLRAKSLGGNHLQLACLRVSDGTLTAVHQRTAWFDTNKSLGAERTQAQLHRNSLPVTRHRDPSETTTTYDCKGQELVTCESGLRSSRPPPR